METDQIDAGWESERARASWSLRCEPPDAADPVVLIAPGIDAMFCVAHGLIVPLAVRAEIAWFDPDMGTRPSSR